MLWKQSLDLTRQRLRLSGSGPFVFWNVILLSFYDTLSSRLRRKLQKVENFPSGCAELSSTFCSVSPEQRLIDE